MQIENADRIPLQLVSRGVKQPPDQRGASELKK